MAKIKIDNELYEKVKKLAEQAGYSSADEFVAHIIERQTAKLEGARNKEEITKHLEGLGYI